jgi:SAM-dependent methyltransferase
VANESAAGNAAYFDSLAPRYDELLTKAPIDLWTRRAFQTLVAETVPAGRLLLDFGCGTGMDASWYGQRGYRVLGYDISEGMLHQLRRRCGSEIASGTIVPVCAPFSDFATAIRGHPLPDAVVSNFSFLTELARPQQFFETIAPLLTPGAPVVVSVLNPFFWKDMTHRWWWTALSRSIPQPAIITRGPGRVAHRHFISSLVRAARPAFHLERKVSVGALVPRFSRTLDWDAPRTFGERLEARYWKTFPLRSMGMFVFLVLRRA